MLGRVDDLLKSGMIVYKQNAMKYPTFPEDTELLTMVRYNDDGRLARLSNESGQLAVTFLAHVKGVAPGQSAVFYEGDDVVGGGIIKSGL